MSKFIDLTNKVFGTLTVLSRDQDKIYHYGGRASISVMYKCRCTCGIVCVVSSQNLKTKKVPSCSNECRRVFITDKLIGKKINELTVINGPISKKKYGLYWDCLCSCGKMYQAPHQALIKGELKFCFECSSNENISKYNSLKIAPHNKLVSGQASLNGLFSSYKRNATGRGLEFSLSLDEFKVLTKQVCNYCGSSPKKQYPNERTVSLSRMKNKVTNGVYIYNGLDRVDNNKGYELGNVVPCCSLCNVMKHKIPLMDWLGHIKAIYEYIKP